MTYINDTELEAKFAPYLVDTCFSPLISDNHVSSNANISADNLAERIKSDDNENKDIPERASLESCFSNPKETAFLYELIQDNFVNVRVYFPAGTYYVVQDDVKISFTDMVSSMGGCSKYVVWHHVCVICGVD